VTYNPQVLSEALRARSLSRSQLSKRLGIKLEDLERELRREPIPKQSILNDIADELALPAFVFFMEKPPRLSGTIPDFRSQNPGPAALEKATIQSIQFAEGVQRAISELIVAKSTGLPLFRPGEANRVGDFALEVRDFFGITLDDQIHAKDTAAFYTVCRKKIEDKGIFVLHDSFPETDGSGYCLWHSTHPVIVVNTKRQTRGRRLFTLIHELAHVLMRKSGISDPFVGSNATEKLCNRFAGSFLVPESYIRSLLGNIALTADPGVEDVALAARRLKISQQATVLRLEEVGLFKSGSHDKWKRLVHNNNPDFANKGGGGGKTPQEKIKLAKYGFHFARTFGKLLSQGRISEIDLYRSTGLKPKYQRPYFAYAGSLTAKELRTLDLDDE
jgi:Zn-dependent peptidase ImmA (M78 family)